MTDEFNKPTPEFNPQKENVIISENKTVLENKPVAENVPVKETLDTRSKPKVEKKFNEKKKNHALSTLSGGLVGAIGVAALGITSMMNVKMNAQIETLQFVDSSLVLNVTVSDMNDDNTLTAYLSEGDKRIQTIALTDEDKDGKIEYVIPLDKEHLKEVLSGTGEHEIKYRVDLKGVVGLNVERAFDSFLVRVNHVGSLLNGINGKCHCEENGNYYFNIDFEDDFSIFEFTSARIEDKFGNTSECVFTENLHETQKIYVLDLQGSKGTLILEYSSEGVPQQPLTLEVEF